MLKEKALTLLVFEVKCPLRVPDEASPWETCLSTSGPDPTHTQKKNLVLVLKGCCLLQRYASLMPSVAAMNGESCDAERKTDKNDDYP